MTRTEAKNLVAYSVKERVQLEPQNEYEWELLRHYYLHMAELITNTTTMNKKEDWEAFQFIQGEVERQDKAFWDDKWEPATNG